MKRLITSITLLLCIALTAYAQSMNNFLLTAPAIYRNKSRKAKMDFDTANVNAEVNITLPPPRYTLTIYYCKGKDKIPQSYSREEDCKVCKPRFELVEYSIRNITEFGVSSDSTINVKNDDGSYSKVKLPKDLKACFRKQSFWE